MIKYDDDKKISILSDFLNQVNSEITRYRNYEWQITVWIVAIQIGLLATLKIIPIEDYDNECFIRIIYLVLILLVCGYGFWHIVYVHKRLTQQRNERNHRKYPWERIPSLSQHNFRL